MNNYKVEKKKFIKECEQALKMIDLEIVECRNRGNPQALIDTLERESKVFIALRTIKLPFVEEAYISEEFLNLLNYCLTSTR